jgi:hypothetical protein
MPTLSISIASLEQLLAQRLGMSSGLDFWNLDELGIYIRQAIREFQVLTGFWRQTVQLTTTAGQPYYDLHANGAIPFTVLDTDILAQVGYHLLEYAGAGAYIHTSQFTIAAVAAAFDQRREEILGEARMVVSDLPGVSGPPPPQGRALLPNSVIQVHRAEWQDAFTGIWGEVHRTDEMNASGWAYQWGQNPSLPTAYSMAATRPFVIQLIPAPVNEGSLEILATVSNPYVIGAAQTIGIPDDSAFALTWGILASVLAQDAQSRDFRRASYAASRFRAALNVLKTFPCVMQAYPGGFSQQPVTLHSLDHWRDGWRNATPALPTVVANAGRNLLACSPVPDAAYNIALDCVANSPASGADSALMDIPGDIVTAILNGAQHLSAFKMGGAEWEGTFPAYQDFLSVAEAYTSRQRAEAVDFDALRNIATVEALNEPYEEAKAEEES